MQDRPVSAIRDELRRVYDGSRPVLGPSADAAVPRHWSSTVAAVGPPDAERHVERVRSWAAAVHDDLAGNRTDAPDR